MRVLQFIPSISLQDGGTTTYIQELAPELGKHVELHVCALGKIEDCVPLPNTFVHTIELSLKNVWTMKRQWMQLLEEVKPEIVHVNCCWMPQCALVQRWTRKKLGHNVKILITPHGMLEPWIIKRNYWTKKVPAILLYQKWAIKDADIIVSTAEEERTHIAQLGWNKEIEMIPNGINVAAIEMKTEWKQPKELLFMSRIHPKKGLEILFEALRETDFILKIAGSGEDDYVQTLKEKVKNEGLEERVIFLGAVYGEQKWQEIQNADIVVLPSYSENFGLIVAEALASGTPVLTTTGTPWSSIKERNCGWWVTPDSSSIKSCLEKITSVSSEEMKRMGERARELVSDLFDVKIQALRFKSLYFRATKATPD